MTDLSKLQNCIERIEEALTQPPSDEQIATLMDAWEEGDKILEELKEKKDDLGSMDRDGDSD